ncbi:phosphate uptake regulator [Paraburkholderia sp. WC7.3g]|uniref:hypothetical protein n=1 Tax=Paraburkholderia sp. WC7.3g TaxID=2991070 RepID=UPI003D22D157
MPDEHLSGRFDADINHVLSKVFEMGGFVESQVVNAMQALTNARVPGAAPSAGPRECAPGKGLKVIGLA